MPRKTKAPSPQSVPVTTEVKIVETREEWSEFKLSDGTTLRMKPVVLEVRRDKGQYTASGDPVYHVKNSIVFDIRAPASLRGKTKTK